MVIRKPRLRQSNNAPTTRRPAGGPPPVVRLLALKPDIARVLPTREVGP